VVLALHTVNRIEALVAQAQAESRAPSLIAAVIRDGLVAHVAAAGTNPVPARDTQYRIGSISKSLTAALVLALRDEGQLCLDDPLGEHLPGVVDAVGKVRLRELLGHTSGLRREPDGEWWERSAGVPLSDLVKGVTAEKLAFAPYTRYHYSNVAYGLLGGVIERITGKSWWDTVSDRLLGPLGMNRTTYQAQEPFARGYVLHPWHQTLREEPRHDAVAMAPAGQLWSTVDDLALWAAVIAAAEPPVLAAPTVAQMATPVVIADPDTWGSGYGLGLQLWRRGERVYVGHTGSMPGYLAVLAAHRPSHTAVVAFANSYTLPGNPIGGFGLSILDIVLNTEPAPPPAPWQPGTPPPPEVEPLCGRWWWMGREFEASWDARATELLLRGMRVGAEEWRFTRVDNDHWRGLSGEQAGEILSIHRDAGGTLSAFDIATFVFTREPLPPE
jgi:CubicO group peptidase (beta-lactamase class C family)